MNNESEEKNEHTATGIYIPGEVAYNYNLTLTEKILFAHLKNLTVKTGYCWASNKYLGKVVDGLGGQTISNSLGKLEEYHYIKIEFNKDSKGMNQRKISINPEFSIIYQTLPTMFHQNEDKLEAEELIKLLLGYIKILIAPYKNSNNILKDINKDYKSKNINIEDKSSIRTKVPVKTPLLIKKKKTTYSEAFVNLSTNTYSQAEEIFDYWNLLSKPLPHHDKTKEKCSYKDSYLSITFKMETKLFQDGIVAISKRLKGNSTKEEIKAAIKQYHNMLADTDKYFIRNGDRLQVVDIANFFEFNKTNKDIQKNRKSTDPFKTIKSWYWECGTAVVKGEQYLIEKYGRKPKTPYQAQPIPDQHPEITEGFKKVWKQQMAKDPWYHNGGGVNDENCFRKASVFLVDFYDRWWDKGLDYLSSTTNIKGMPMLLSDPKTMVWEFIKAINSATEGMSNDKEITPAWLCGPGMEKRLLTYYRDQGILNDLSDQQEY